MKMMRKFVFILMVIGYLVTVVSPAMAHRVVVYAYLTGDKLVAECAFGDGKPVKVGKVKIYDEQDQVIKEGKTDEQGLYETTLTESNINSDLKVVLNAGLGHQATYTIKANNENNQQQKDSDIDINSSRKNSAMVAGVSEEQLRMIVDQELDKKLDPVMKSIGKLQEASERPGMTEILGGIGYIIGLMGIAFYFKAGGKKSDD